MTREKKFFDALKDVFVGAKVEGESGYINLMRIKSRYYTEYVFPKLKEDVDSAVEQFPEFREELFDKLYDFFHQYFSESGSIYFRHTPLHKTVYEQVYTEDRDVMLFWKTHMLYYVKADRLFQSMEVEIDEHKFSFDVSTLKHKKANEKRALVYSFKEKLKDNALVLEVAYSEHGRKTKPDEILREIRQQDVSMSKATLDRAFRVFEKQSEVDYFINKDAKAFLREQFDLWVFQYIFKGESHWTQQRIRQLQTIRDFAYKIIEFISQFEDELVRIWNKPRFALNSNYIITLDRIAVSTGGIQLLKELTDHDNFEKQIREWQELGIVGKSFKRSTILQKQGKKTSINKLFDHLPLDTKYFKDLELRIIGLFENLDESLDGWLVKSENYQALNTMRLKLQGNIGCTYIDPPYNSKSSEILYSNVYKHSSWLTLMENRLTLSKAASAGTGSHVIAVDENEQERLGGLLETVFPNHSRVCVAIIHNKKGIQGNYFSYSHDFAYFCIPSELEKINEKPIPEAKWEYDNLRKWGTESERSTAKNCFYSIQVKDKKIIGFGDVCSDSYHPGKANIAKKDGSFEIYPVDPESVERKWRYARASVEAILPLLKVHETKDGELQILKPKISRQFKTVWDDPLYIAGDYGTRLLTEMGIFPEENLYPKSIHTVMDSIHAVADSGALILDYFAGSGTTAHATIRLNREDSGGRKYLLVEMGSHYETVILPRIKKAVFSDSWSGGEPAEGQGSSHFAKYLELEQYEDTLKRAKYDEADLFDDPNKDPYNQYIFLRDLKLLEALEVDTKKGSLRVDLGKLYKEVDIAETLSYLYGKRIKQITTNSVEFEDGEKVDTENLDWKNIKPLIWW